METNERLLPAPLSGCEAKRICLIKPSSLGDVVQALPILAMLRRRFPHSEISWVANRSYAALLTPIDELDDVIQFDRSSYQGRPFSNWLRFRAFTQILRQRRFDLTIDLQGLLRSGLMTSATKAPVRIGLRSAREGSTLFYTHLADDLRCRSAVERYWAVANLLGAGRFDKRFPLSISEQERNWAREKLAPLPRPRLAVNPGARWQTKRWPADRFATVTQNAFDHGQLRSAVVLGGPGEEVMAEECQKLLRMPVANFCGTTSLRQLAALLAECDLMLTNDTGPMHLAAALGVPTVSLFTCTSPERAAPFGENHRIVQTDVPCRASYLRECNKMVCLEDLTVERVFPAVSESMHLIEPEVLARSLAQNRAA